MKCTDKKYHEILDISDVELQPPITLNMYTNGCPDNLEDYYYERKDGTKVASCYCEDHCRWDKCFLSKAPNHCLVSVNGTWSLAPDQKYWVAQVSEGIEV